MSPVPVAAIQTVPLYDENNILYRVNTMDADGVIVAVTEFYPDKNIQSSYEMKEGILEGEFVSFYPNGEVDEYGFYVRGQRDGRFTKNHPNGKLWMEQHYLNGKLHGRSTYFDEAGNMTLRMQFRHDVLHGLYESFYADGTREMSVQYKSGDSAEPFVRRVQRTQNLPQPLVAKVALGSRQDK